MIKTIFFNCFTFTEALIPSLQIAQNPVIEGNEFMVQVQLNIPSSGVTNDITLTLSTADGTASRFMLGI